MTITFNSLANSGFALPSTTLQNVALGVISSIIKPAKSMSDDQVSSSGLGAQGSVSFGTTTNFATDGSTDAVFTSFTNPASIVGLSVSAPELITSIDFVPLYGDDDSVNEGVYNAIYYNVLLDSLTKEAARNCLIKLIKNENGEFDNATSAATNITIGSRQDFLDALAGMSLLSFNIRQILSDSSMLASQNALLDVFNSIRETMMPSEWLPVTSTYFGSWGGSAPFLDMQDFSPRRITDVDNFHNLVTGDMEYSEDEFRNSSSTKLVAQIVQDLRRCILYGSKLFDPGVEERDTSENGFAPYDVFDDGSSGSFQRVISGLNSLNQSMETVDGGSVVSRSDFAIFDNSLYGLSLTERMVIISQIISRDIAMSFLKRTDYVHDVLDEFGAKSDNSTGIFTNPSVETIVDQLIGDIGGSLFSSAPAGESIASLINPQIEDGTKIFSFERFSVDSSFGDAIHGFGAFAGDFVHQIQEFIETSDQASSGEITDFNFEAFAKDFTSKAQSIAALVPVLIGGARSSNSFFRALCYQLSDYLSDNGFVHDNDVLQSVLSTTGTSWSDVSDQTEQITRDPVDELEFIRLAIFIEAGSNSEIAHLLSQFLDARRLYKKQEDIIKSSISGTGVIEDEDVAEEVDSEIDAIQRSYDDFYNLALELTEKILDVSDAGDGVGILEIQDEAYWSSSGVKRYVAHRTVDNIQVTSEEEDFSTAMTSPKSIIKDRVGLMRSPVGLALLTIDTSTSRGSIFDLPDLTLLRFYSEFVGDDFEGIALTDKDDERIRLVLEEEFRGSDEPIDIITDFRGYTDTLRRRAYCYIIGDLLSSIEITNSGGFQTQVLAGDLSVIPIGQREESAIFQEVTGRSTDGSGPPTKGDLFSRGSPTFIQQASFDAEFYTVLRLDTARTTQLALACAKFSRGGLYSLNDSVNVNGYGTNISNALNSAFGEAYDITIEESIRDIHAGLIKEYTRCEAMSEALVAVGNVINSKYEDILSFTTNPSSHIHYLDYCDLSAKNAVANEGMSISYDDALSAMFSACMTSEAYSLVKNLREGSRTISSAGFFDEDLSEDGKTASSRDLLIPSCEVIPSKILSNRIIPGLGLLQPNPSTHEDGLESGEFSTSKGDPDDDRLEILTVGLPHGLIEKLREEAENYASYDGYEPEDYSSSPHISIKVYKKDLDRGDVVYKPRNYIFDTRLLSSTRTYGGLDPMSSAIDVSAETLAAACDEAWSTSAHDKSALDSGLGAGTGGYQPDGTFPGTSADDSSSESINEKSSTFTGLYPNLTWDFFIQRGDEYNTAPSVTDLGPDANDGPISINADEINRNHLQDYILKEYLKIIGGIDVNERAFPLFEKGCSYASSVDGGGLGTQQADFDFITGYTGNAENLSLSMGVQSSSDGYYNQVRSDILSMVAEGIDAGAFGDLDLATSSSENVASKLRQSFLFSPEKYLNQAFCPTLFERVFCILVDPDGFEIDYEETSEDTVAYLQDGAVYPMTGTTYLSEVFSFFVTVELLPYQSDLDNT